MIWRIIILIVMRMIMTWTIWKIVMMTIMSVHMPDLILNPLTWTSSCAGWNHQVPIENAICMKVTLPLYYLFNGDRKESNLRKYFAFTSTVLEAILLLKTELGVFPH